MRPLSLLALLAPCLGLAQSGVYRASSGEEARWSINPNHTLIWNSVPYLPFGLRIGASEAEIREAKAAGIKDVVVDCPPNAPVLKEAVELLEAEGLSYILSISTLAPTARGVLVEPQGNRFFGVDSRRTLRFTIHGADEAFVVLAVRRDNAIQKTLRVKGKDGAFSIEIEPPNDLEHVAYIFPFTSSLAQLGAWEGFDAHRDELLNSLKRAGLGKGLRGILNPLGSFASRTGPRSFVPTGRLFRFEFEAHLKQTYRNPETAMRSWSMSGGIETPTFALLARLVPLWSGMRGLPVLWDPTDDKLYPCEIRRSTIWRDLDTVLSSAESRRAERLISSIRGIANVPILQEWVGWSPLYEGAPHGLDGIAARTSGATPSLLAETASRCASSLLRWTRPGWFLATQVDTSGIQDAAAMLGPVLDDLTSIGVRGAFVRSSDQGHRSALAQAANLRGQDGSLAQWSPKPLFFPESASNPASTMRLPGGAWWLPSPEAGNRIDFGSQFCAYRIDGTSGTRFVLWSKEGQVRAKLQMKTPARAVFTTLDGSDANPRVGRDHVEVTLTELPVLVTGIDEIPVPQIAYQELLHRFQALLADAERRRADTTEDQYLFRDYASGFDRNPGGNYASMLAVFQKLSLRLARYLWVEAESTRASNFSEIASEPGASNGNALALRTQLVTLDGDYTAEYLLSPRTEDEVEVWISARINPADRDSLRLHIGGQDLSIEGEALSAYGSGFAWYSMGKTRLGRGQTKVTLRVKAPQGADLAIDAILLHAGSFRPDGVRPPDAIAYPPFAPKKA